MSDDRCCAEGESKAVDSTKCCLNDRIASPNGPCCEEGERIFDGKCVRECCDDEYETGLGTCG